jgi:hypothetical protein
MNDMFEEVLAICLDRLADGDTVAACVADFPECPDLEPLLSLAAALSDVGATAPQPVRGPTRLYRRPLARLRPTG